jgi:hypothetical protein
MAQHDYNIANQSGQAFRADLNNALAAIVSGNSGASAPSTTFAYQYWVDTSSSPALLKQRNAANNAWITIGRLDTANLQAGLGSIVNADVNASAGIVASKLSFTQAGSGAVARTVDSKLKDVVSVKDFGATGNGTTDDTAAIQAAINAALSQPITSGGAGTVFFPAGNYKVTSTINIPPRSGQTYKVNLRICGIGNGGVGGSSCTITAGAGFTGTAVFKYDQGNIPLSVTEIDLEFDHLLIAGSFNVANGIEIFSPIGVSIHEIGVTFCTASCIKLTGGLDGGYSVSVKNIYVHGGNPDLSSNWAEYGVESTARYALYERIVMDGAQTGLRISGDSCIVQNCHLEGQATCIDFITAGAGNARITSNLLNPYGAGVWASWPASGIAIKMTSQGAGAALRNFIGFNQIDATAGPASTGIYLDSVYQTQIFANRVSGAVNGIYLTAAAANDRVTFIEGNTFISCTNDINNQTNGGRLEVGGGNYGSAANALTFSGFKSPVRGYQWGQQVIWARHAGVFTGTSVVDGLVLYNGQTGDLNDGVRLKFDFSDSTPLSQARSASITARSKLNYGSATELVFSTANDYTAEAERLILQKDGILRPTVDNTQSLGSASFRWSTVFAGTGTINTSDARNKQQGRSLSDAEKTVAIKVKGLLKAFKFNDAVEAKGDDARIHFGVYAQELADAFASEGLDANKYGLFCYDEWDADLDADGNETRPAGDRYGIRYEELLAFVLAAL